MVAQPPVCDFGWPAPAFDLPGIDGRNWTLSQVSGPCATVVMFLCNHCPYVVASARKIVRDAQDLKEHGVGMVAIMPNDTDAYPADDFPRMIEFAQEHHFSFPYLIDRTQAVARAYGAVCTPDFFGFDRSGGLQYRGRLDDARAQPHDGSRRDLYEAMKGVAAGRGGPPEQHASMGCSIKWRAS